MKQGWEYKKLDDVALIKGRIGYRGYTKNDLVPAGEGAITLSPANITDYKISYEKCQYISWFKYEESPEIMIYNGDIIYAKTASIGKVALVKDLPEKATINPQFVVLKEIKCDNSYLYYVLRSNHFKQAISLITNGVAIPTVSQSNMGNILIPIPPIEEQKAICSLLDKMNCVIEAKKEQLKELDNLAQAIFYDMFGDPVENEKGWKVKKLEDFCSTITKGTTPTTIGFQFENQGISFVKVEAFTENDDIDISKISYISSDCNNVMSRSQLKEDDILICIAGATVGKLSKVNKTILPANTNQACAIIRLKDNQTILNTFLYGYLKHSYIKHVVDKLKKGVAQPNLSLSQVRGFDIIIPPLSLQQAFSEKVKSIEQQKELINQSIKDVQTLFDAKMDYYFGE